MTQKCKHKRKQGGEREAQIQKEDWQRRQEEHIAFNILFEKGQGSNSGSLLVRQTHESTESNHVKNQ